MFDIAHKRSPFLTGAVLMALLAALVIGGVASGQSTQPQGTATFDWRSDWAVADGYTIVKDTTGYNLPSTIAFVPEPGPNPKDPLYFITELRGQLKVVTNDRSIYTFTENFQKFTPEEELPSGRGQGGMAGICLDPKHGYIFVTFLYNNERGALRNNIVRYRTTPGTFGLQPDDQVAFTDTFKNYESGLAHHIGPCQVVDDQLFVGIGEAWQPHLAQDQTQMVGKLYRMSLDGKPLPDNPFYEDDDITRAVNYVWAMGLRNPYSLKIIDGEVFVGDNGLGTDRFLKVERGENYLWNGVETSLHLRASYVWTPSLGPTQLQYLPADSALLDERYRGRFFLGMTGAVNRSKWPGIQQFPVDLPSGQMEAVPEYFVRWRGKGEQMVVGLAFGPDGLYFAPIYPNQDGETPVYKVIPDPSNSYPYKPTQTDDPLVLIREKGCLGCHRLGTDGGFGGTAGPVLDRELLVARVQARLENDLYRQSLVDLDQLPDEPWASTRDARAAVLAAKGDEAVRLWVEAQIREPRWAIRASQMPNMSATEEEAALVAAYLLQPSSEPTGLMALLPKQLRGRTPWATFAGGLVLGAGALGSTFFVRGRLQRKRNK